MRTIRVFLSLSIVFISFLSLAQKKQLITEDEQIINKAQEFLSQSASNGDLKLKAAELGIKGEFTLDITVHKNGNVLTIFSPFEIRDEKVKPQNQLKDLLMKYEFPFKMPKNKRVKFRQIFSFS